MSVLSIQTTWGVEDQDLVSSDEAGDNVCVALEFDLINFRPAWPYANELW